ncbi:methyltransferase domain-containing protein [Gordonia soli]|uniref:Trans-aconitate 2-methyltransferase n=1 Tax=Gordonia soli NBRC 108243 TaxID=1223545 RepID=M0QHW3_9ACTN|nr:methyltransferase domain-containing protein [Gordonia soli]GAC67012.1 trans-aconitate 2-methyltransferase [Gordonia soli NBRC 108243]
MTSWDPSRYLQFSDDRSRPFLDLIARVPTHPSTIVDLGCGPGHLTQHLRARWSDAEILGVDSSPDMIARAQADNQDPRASYVAGDAATWHPDGPIDLLVSNAMFQWVDDQFTVIERLATSIADAGAFAIQVPDNAESPTHRILSDVAARPRFEQFLSGVRRLPRSGPADYLEFFATRGWSVDAWSTTYLHVLQGDNNPVFEWLSGTGARPFLQALDDDLREEYAFEVSAELQQAYPRREFGTVLPFQRTFVVAHR